MALSQKNSLTLTQNPFTSILVKGSFSKGEEKDTCSVLFQRHRFLLVAITLLAILCTIYLYFAITFGVIESCTGLTGEEKAQCKLELAKRNMGK